MDQAHLAAMGSKDSEETQCNLSVTLRSHTPVVGCEINPKVTVRPAAPSTPHYVKYTWYRLDDDKARCCIHPSEMATFQCLSCVALKIPTKESYHCSTKCYREAWNDHLERHCKATATMSRSSNVGQQRAGYRRSCGSWPSPDDWFDFRNASVLDITTNTLDKECKIWTKVGSSKTYVPAVDDYACILKLESVVVDSKEGNLLSPKQIVRTECVIFAPTPDPRCMIQFETLHGSWDFHLEGVPSLTNTFSVLSYNILSDIYTLDINNYSYCPSWAMTWEYRRENLLREIIGYNADIICLQEVQSDHFKDFFEPKLVSRGYSVVYKKKKTETFIADKKFVTEGCATFFRRDKFREVKKYELDYSELALKVVNTLQPEKQEDARRRVIKDNLAIVVILEQMENGKVPADLDCRFCVANTHIHSNTSLADVKLLQVASLINGLEKIAAVHVPILICGDLNSLPSSAPHNLVVKGKLDPDQKGTEGDPLGIYQWLKLFHKLRLVSAYSSFLKVDTDLVSEQQKNMMDCTLEPLFTNFTGNFFGTLDYIFYTADRFEVRGLLELLDVESAEKHTALPSPEWSSDHIALMAELYLKPKRRYLSLPPLPASLW